MTSLSISSDFRRVSPCPFLAEGSEPGVVAFWGKRMQNLNKLVAFCAKSLKLNKKERAKFSICFIKEPCSVSARVCKTKKGIRLLVSPFFLFRNMDRTEETLASPHLNNLVNELDEVAREFFLACLSSEENRNIRIFIISHELSHVVNGDIYSRCTDNECKRREALADQTAANANEFACTGGKRLFSIAHELFTEEQKRHPSPAERLFALEDQENIPPANL